MGRDGMVRLEGAWCEGCTSVYQIQPSPLYKEVLLLDVQAVDPAAPTAGDAGPAVPPLDDEEPLAGVYRSHNRSGDIGPNVHAQPAHLRSGQGERATGQPVVVAGSSSHAQGRPCHPAEGAIGQLDPVPGSE